MSPCYCCCCCWCRAVLQWAEQSPLYRRYFTPSGRLALEVEYQVAQEPLERILVEEHGMEQDEVGRGWGV